MNTQCNCYTLVDKIEYRPNWRYPGGYEKIKVQKGYCRGTKEYEECFCKGNPYDCDFYDEVKKKAQENKLETKIKKAKKLLEDNGYTVKKKKKE